MEQEKQEYKYMVCTRCFTYNQAPYIVDAMNGFTMQKTTFPVITCIVDDASTDGEPEVIRQYLTDHFQAPYREEETDDYHLICANHNANPNCTFVVFFLRYNHHNVKKSKLAYLEEWINDAYYGAICEGDDYWTEPSKLEWQVSYLEANNDCVLCVHNYRYYEQESGQFLEHNRFYDNFIFDNRSLFERSPAQILTTVYRLSAAPSKDTIRQYKYYRDNHFFYLLLQNGYGYYINRNMGVYRRTGKGIWTSLNAVEKLEIDLNCYLELLSNHDKDNRLRTFCAKLYASYIYVSKVNKKTISFSPISVLGLRGTIEAFARYFYTALHSLWNKNIRKKSMITK